MLRSLNFSFLFNYFELNQIDSAKILQRLAIESIEEFDSLLQQNLAIRATQQTSHQYIIQSSTLENSLSYLFTPFIQAVLNQNTVYIAPRTNIVEQVYTHYFRLDALALQNQQSILEMSLCLDLVPADFNAIEFKLYALAKALLDPACQHIVMIGKGGLEPNIKDQLTQVFKIKVDEISLNQQQFDVSEIDFKKLFWKRKTPELAHICQRIARENAALIGQNLHLKLKDAEHLIDDLMYSEHLFEKLSVFGEFTETIFKNHLESKLRAVNE